MKGHAQQSLLTRSKDDVLDIQKDPGLDSVLEDLDEPSQFGDEQPVVAVGRGGEGRQEQAGGRHLQYRVWPWGRHHRRETERPGQERGHLTPGNRIPGAVQGGSASERDTGVCHRVDVRLVSVTVVVGEPVDYRRQQTKRSSQKRGHLGPSDGIVVAIDARTASQCDPSIGDGVDVRLVDRSVVVVEMIKARRDEVECPGQEGRHLAPCDAVVWAVPGRVGSTAESDALGHYRFDVALVGVAVVVYERAARRQRGGRQRGGNKDQRGQD